MRSKRFGATLAALAIASGTLTGSAGFAQADTGTAAACCHHGSWNYTSSYPTLAECRADGQDSGAENVDWKCTAAGDHWDLYLRTP